MVNTQNCDLEKLKKTLEGGTKIIRTSKGRGTDGKKLCYIDLLNNDNSRKKGNSQPTPSTFVARLEDSDKLENWLKNKSLKYEYESPVEMLIILIDIVGFSQNSSCEQLYVLKTFENLVFEKGAWGDLNNYIIDILSTGDGFYILAKKCFIKNIDTYLCGLVKRIDEYNRHENPQREINFRCALNIGEVYKWKWKKGDNYIGQGMNDCQRIISFIPKKLEDVIYFSDSVYKAMLSPSGSHPRLQRLGRMYDKHGKPHKIFQLSL